MRVFRDVNNQYCSFKHSSLFFEIEPKWQWTKNFKDADIVFFTNTDRLDLVKLINSEILPHQTVVLLQIFHIDHHHTAEFYRDSAAKIKAKKVIVIHKNAAISSNSMIYFDHMHDRQKLYCTAWNRRYHLDTRYSTRGASKEIYAITNFTKTTIKNKFLCLMRIYGAAARMTRRKQLRSLIKRVDALYSKPEAGIFLRPYCHRQFEHLLEDTCWYPADQQYYNQTLISVYIETLVEGDQKFISEKTLDPLIQGNFILPFGYAGLIKDIQSMGFLLPEVINYGYDDILDNDQRFEAYCQEIRRINSIPTDELMFMLADWEWQRHHNRNLFFEKEFHYPTLYEKIKTLVDQQNLT